MIVVHHLHQSRSQRIPWLLEELGVPYELVDHGRIRGLAPPGLEAVHPLGKAPVIVDDGRVVAESGAIITYLVERYGKGRLGPPEDTDARLAWHYWMHYAEGSLMPLVVMRIVFARMQRARWPVRTLARAVLKPVSKSYLQPNLDKHIDWVDAALEERPWFAGNDFTAADIQMSVPLLALARGGHPYAHAMPNIHAFIGRMSKRDGYRRASERIQACELHGGDA